MSRVGSCQKGRVKRFSNLLGWVGSGHEVFKIPRVGSGHDPRERVTRGSGTMTRELFSADPKVGPTDLARGSAFSQNSQLPAGGPLS